MWQVILLILSGGWHKEIEKNILKNIHNQITENGLENLLSDVPEKEAELFRHDLQILELIPK